MATVREASDPYAHFMRSPLPPQHGVCAVCSTFCTGYSECFRCSQDSDYTDAVYPISLSVHMGQLHTALRQYKDSTPQVMRKFQTELAAVLWRSLESHEDCLAAAAGVDRFDVVTTVPSGSRERDERHPLRTMVGEWIRPTASRHRRLLRRSDVEVALREVNPEKYTVDRDVRNQAVLLIEDTWTTGASVQSAAGALRAAGAAAVGVTVIGRHIHDDYADNSDRLRALPKLYDWAKCPHHR